MRVGESQVVGFFGDLYYGVPHNHITLLTRGTQTIVIIDSDRARLRS